MTKIKELTGFYQPVLITVLGLYIFPTAAPLVLLAASTWARIIGAYFICLNNRFL